MTKGLQHGERAQVLPRRWVVERTLAHGPQPPLAKHFDCLAASALASRGPQADDALAAKIGKSVEESLKSLVTDQLRTQMRPGGMLAGGRR